MLDLSELVVSKDAVADLVAELQRREIFCNKLEAELLAIDGCYRTAEDIEPNLHSQPVQAWLHDDISFIAPLDQRS